MKALEILKTFRDDYYYVYERGLAKKEDVLKYDEAIEELEELMKPKTCETCKYYDGSHKCNNDNSIAWETSNRVYGDDYCKDYDQKSRKC